MLVWLKETRPAGVQAGSVLASFSGYGAVFQDRVMLAFCLIAMLPNYAFGQIWATMPVMLSGLHGVTAARWSVAMIVYGVCMVALQYPVVRVLGRRDLMLALSLSCVAQGAGITAAAFVPWPWTLVCIAAIALGIVLLIPIATTVVSRLAPVHLRGRYMGVWTLVYMGGYAMGPLLGGWALDASAAACRSHHGRGVPLGAALFPLLGRAVRDRVREQQGLPADEALGGELIGERPEQVV